MELQRFKNGIFKTDDYLLDSMGRNGGKNGWEESCNVGDAGINPAVTVKANGTKFRVLCQVECMA